MKRFVLAFFLLAISNVPAKSQLKDAPPPTPGGTRIAIVNIGYVFNSFEKGRKFKALLEQDFEPYKAKARQLNDEINKCQDAIRRGNGDVGKLQADIDSNKRDLEELSLEMQRVLGKKQEENLVAIWKDVQAAIKSYATENKIDVVLGHGDPLDKALMDLFPIVNRKMQAMDSGGTVPLFVASAADISEPVTAMLNKRLRGEK